VPLRGSPLEAVISAAGMSNGQKAGGAGVAGAAVLGAQWGSCHLVVGCRHMAHI